MRSPRESVVPMNSLGGMPLLKSSGFVASITTLPAKLVGPARRSAASVAVPRRARTIRSPNCAASANVPEETSPPALATNSCSFSGSREPMRTGWP